MKARLLLMTVLLGMLTGCTDTADSVAREYRNQINEGLDAMMLVTDEASANRMTVRVFKPMEARFKDIDRRLDIVRANRTKKEFAAEFGLSDSVNMFITEVYLNRNRYRQEMERLKDLTKKITRIEQEKHEKSGSQEPFDPNASCKALQQIITENGGALSALDSQLNKTPKMFTMLNEMKQWKLDEAFLTQMKKKSERFTVPTFGELK